jgi:hypothetical protein
MLEVINFQEWRSIKDPSGRFLSTVSRSNDWGAGFSPFKLGPCQMWGGHVATNVENAWQFSKTYPEHLEDDGSVGQKWLYWAQNGWNDPIARRYPMGKDAKPLFSYWNGRRLNYTEARKAIYIPLYAKAVLESGLFGKLVDEKDMADADEVNLYLVDFDAYRHKGLDMSYRDVVECTTRKQGHAFVLAMMLEAPEILDGIISEGIALRERA